MEKLKVVISPAGKRFEARVRRVAGFGLEADARLIYRGSRNEVAVVGSELNVKAFGVPAFPNSFVYRYLRKSKARRSYEHALELKRLGFLTPEPYGYAEELSAGGLRRSYYFCRQELKDNMRLWEGNPQIEKLVDQWGAEIARLHAAGVWIKDHSAGNVLLGKDAAGNFTFSYVDLNRIRFNEFSERRLLQMFKSVSTSIHFTLLLARSYARAAGKDERDVVRKVKRIFMRFNKRK